MPLAEAGFSDPAVPHSAAPQITARVRRRRSAAPPNRHSVQQRTSPLYEAGATFRPYVLDELRRQEEP